MIADVTVKPPKKGCGESNKVHYPRLERGATATAPAAATPGGAARAYRRVGRRVRQRSLEALIHPVRPGRAPGRLLPTNEPDRAEP